MRTARVFRLVDVHPSDLSELEHLIAAGIYSCIGSRRDHRRPKAMASSMISRAATLPQTLMALLSRHPWSGPHLS